MTSNPGRALVEEKWLFTVALDAPERDPKAYACFG
jgi:hypothetical protein